MASRFIRLFLGLFLTMALLPAQVVFADTGPKPSMHFTFHQEIPGEQLTITSGILFECNQPDCSDAEPIEEVGPQGFRCELTACSAVAYGFAPYHQIEIEFSDGNTRQSNIFETAGFDSEYTGTIRADDLLVDTQLSSGFLPRTGTIIVACLCVLTGLMLLAGLAIFLVRRSRTA